MMVHDNAFLRLARMGESLLSEGHIYVGFTYQSPNAIWQFRHPNGRRLRIISDGKDVALWEGDRCLHQLRQSDLTTP